MSPHYSLTEATEKYLNHYPRHQETASGIVRKFNTHKVRHTLGVVETGRNLIIKLKERIDISDEIANRAEMVLFFHDIARFYQNDGNEIISEKIFEHGDVGYLLAEEEGYDEKVCLAIKYHNKFNMLGLYGEPEYQKMSFADQAETEFLTKIVRDADKLQNMIFSLFHVNGLASLSINLKPGDICQEVLDDLQKHISVSRQHIITIADYVLSVLSRKFDLNFPESLEMLEYYGYFPKTLKEISKLPGVSQEKIEILKKVFVSTT